MARRLRDDLLLRLLLPMATILLVSGILSYQLSMRFANRSYDRTLLEDTRALARIAGAAVGRPLELPPAALAMLQNGDGERASFQVRSLRYGVVAGDPQIPSPADEAIDEPTFYDGAAAGRKLRLAAIPVLSRDARDTLLVIVAETRDRRDALAGDIFAAVVFPQLALIFFAIVVIVGGIESGLRPLEDLAEALKRRRRDELDPLPDAQVPGEAQPLIAAFNGVLARLQEMLAVQQRFVADAAHQLRTPLAALHIQIEQALRESDAARKQQQLLQLKSSVDRTARLSGQLLLLARAEPGGAPTEKVAVDLRALACEVGAAWVPRALDAGRDLGFSASAGVVPVVGDRLLLGELLGNLIDNALNYGGPHVTVSVVAGAEGPELVVEDDGGGIPATERERVFERFHRVPGTGGEGSGLGLAIVREIAHGHGAAVRLETAAEGGLRVRVRFPPREHRHGTA